MTMEQKFNALAAYVLAEGDEQKEITRKALNAAMREPEIIGTTDIEDIEDIIHQYLMEMAANPALMGYKYVVYGIQQVMNNPSLIDNITSGLYPVIARKFDTSPARVERAIRHSIEYMWENGDLDTLISYFGYTAKSESGKPTNSNFMARIALIVKSRLKK